MGRIAEARGDSMKKLGGAAQEGSNLLKESSQIQSESWSDDWVY
jgi:hypothetical protein